MFESLTLRGVTFAPALFCAPMAGISHSAFRRLVAEFGGYGALFTEMLAARAMRQETFANSPYVRRRPEEGFVIYQILAGSAERLDDIMERVRSYGPAGVDVNLACGEHQVRRSGAGSALFDDPENMKQVLGAIRRGFGGPLTVKLRLGHDRPDWQETFSRRAAIIRDSGVDGAILHPRFTGQKLRRHARHDLLDWAARELRLPLIVSGDLGSAADVEARRPALECAAGLMVGRMAAVQPWVFAAWNGRRPEIDPGAVWLRLCQYVAEDFHPDRQLARVKMFTEYYARNFLFGHTLYSRVQSSDSLTQARQRAEEFFAGNPELLSRPNVLGIS